MKMKKKIMSLVLALALCFTLCVPVFAADEATRILNSNAYNAQIEEDMNILETTTLFITSDKLSVIGVDDEGEVLYGISDESGITSVVSVTSDETNHTIKVTEDDITNEVTFMADGRIILDGHELSFFHSVASADVSRQATFIPYNIILPPHLSMVLPLITKIIPAQMR